MSVPLQGVVTPSEFLKSMVDVLYYGAVADALYKDDSTGLWYKDEAKTIRATDNTNAFANTFNSGYGNIVIPPGNYLVNGECMIQTNNISITCLGNIYAEPKNTSAQYVMNVFCFHNCKNVRVNGVRIYSDRLIDTSIIWQTRNRSINLSSQRIGFNLCGTENCIIENCYFDGLEYDFKIDVAHGATAENLLEVNKGNVIRNIKSYRCSQPILMNHSSYITVSYYTAEVAEGLSTYEHFIYFNSWVKHVYIDNCVVKSDEFFGPVFNLRVSDSTSGTTYSDSDVHDIHVSDCVFDGCRSIATLTNTNDLYISNCKLLGFEGGNLGSSTFNVSDAAQLSVNGGYFEVGAPFLGDAGSGTKMTFKAVEIITKNRFINSTSVSTKNIVFNGCKITMLAEYEPISASYLYISNTQIGSFIFNGCTFRFLGESDVSTIFSVRNKTLLFIANNCIFISKVGGALFYSNALAGKNVKFLNCYLKGFTRLAAVGELESEQVANTVVESSMIDSFNRADSAASLGNTQTGQTWEAVSGVWGISNNMAYIATPSGGAHIVVADSGMSDCEVSGKLVDNTGDVGLIVRYVDEDNYLALTKGATSYDLNKIEDGASTLVKNFTVTPAAGDLLELILSGSSIILNVNGAYIDSATTSFNQTATKHGLIGNSSTSRYDNFKVLN